MIFHPTFKAVHAHDTRPDHLMPSFYFAPACSANCTSFMSYHEAPLPYVKITSLASSNFPLLNRFSSLEDHAIVLFASLLF